MDKDDEIALLRRLLAEAVRRSVGTHDSIVMLATDLERDRPDLIVTPRSDGAWILRFDVRKKA